jgi:hypothetical protein
MYGTGSNAAILNTFQNMRRSRRYGEKKDHLH